ncbi:MAG: hypothetical protein SFU56_00375 [Capsulimonadales bacterium]|nr:hypothetical protein [Capsulimonadales bacterium]
MFSFHRFSPGVSLLTLALSCAPVSMARAQEEPAPAETIHIAIDGEADRAEDTAARQQAANTLRQLGLTLDWRKASLAELKRTQTDLVAAGDDEDLRQRVILAARLRERGIRLDWRKHSSDTLMERFMAARETTNESDERSAVVETAPPPKPRTVRTTRRSRTDRDSNVTYELPPNPPPARENWAPGEIAAYEAQVRNPGYFEPYVPPVYVVPGYTVVYPPALPGGETTTYTTSDNIRITTYGRPGRPDCNPPQGIPFRRYQPGAPITPRPPQPIVRLPGGRPGVPGVIPIVHPRIEWPNGNRTN